MPNDREQLIKAQQLLKAGKYEQARPILQAMPHNPTAEKWLARLDGGADLEDPFAKPLVVVMQPTEMPKKKSGGCYRYLVGTVVILFILAYFAAQTMKNGSSTLSSSSSPSRTAVPGSTRDKPIPAGVGGAVQDGAFTVEALYLDVGSIVNEMNMFNTEPDPGQAWALVRVSLQCELASTRTCNADLMDIRLTGRLGKLYEKQRYDVLENVFQGEIFGGNQISGLLGFIVDAQDGNFAVVVNELLHGRIYFAVNEKTWAGS